MLIYSGDEPPGSYRELEIFLLSVCLLLSQKPNCMKTPLYHSSLSLDSVDLSGFFPCTGKGISGINNPLKCHQIPWSPRELGPQAGGTDMLALDIKQHFISYYDVATSYNCSFQRGCSKMVGYKAYYTDIV